MGRDFTAISFVGSETGQRMYPSPSQILAKSQKWDAFCKACLPASSWLKSISQLLHGLRFCLGAAQVSSKDEIPRYLRSSFRSAF